MTGGSVVLVATPIGNLGDLSPRARDVLGSADVVCCEDTRRTRALLVACGLPSNPSRLVSLHGHNEASRVPEVLDWVRRGKTVAVVSDAGTPTVSDPGRRLVSAAAAAGLAVTAVPGPSAVLMALSVSGLDTERFCVEGFVARRGPERRRLFERLASAQSTAVLLEAPGRVAGLLAELHGALGDRPVAVCRELTKLHEEVWRGSLGEAAEEFTAREILGEVVIVLGKAIRREPADDDVRAAVRARLEAGDTPRTAAQSVADELGVPRRRAYREALDQRDADSGRSAPGGSPGRR